MFLKLTKQEQPHQLTPIQPCFAWSQSIQSIDNIIERCVRYSCNYVRNIYSCAVQSKHIKSPDQNMTNLQWFARSCDGLTNKGQRSLLRKYQFLTTPMLQSQIRPNQYPNQMAKKVHKEHFIEKTLESVPVRIHMLSITFANITDPQGSSTFRRSSVH